jgi:tetratricopeptide (TPR) repeat protein
MRPWTLAMPFAVLAALGAPASAQEDRDVKARDLFLAGKYHDALDIYSRLEADTHHPTYLRNIGRCHQMMHQPDQAIFYFRAYLRDARDLSAQERTEIDGYISEMQAVRAAQAPPAATMTLPPTLVTPASVFSEPVADTTPITRKWWFWTALGALVAGGVITALVVGGNSGRLPCPAETQCPR